MSSSKRNTPVLYRHHSSLKTNDCFYCGEYADTKDHVPAVFHVDFFPDHEKFLVRCCLLCNVLLSGRPFPTLRRRVNFLLQHYPKRFKRIINSPHWSQEEISELTGLLKRTVIREMRKKEMVTRKLSHLEQLFIFLPEE